MAVLLSSAVTMLMHIALVWTLSGEGINRIMLSIVTIFTGMVIPLPLFPDRLQPFCTGNLYAASSMCRTVSTVGTSARGCRARLCSRHAGSCSSSGGRWLLSVSIRRLVVQGG